MGDTEDTNNGSDAAPADTGTDTDTEVTTEDESDTSQNNGDEDDAGASDDSDDDGKGNSDSESDTADDDAEEDVDDGETPELRKPKKGDSNAKWAAWRAQEKAKKEKSGQSGDSSDGSEDGTDDDETADDDPVAKEVAKQLAPFKKQVAEQEVDTEIASFLANNPDFKPFAAKARRWALHPNRDGVPVKAIFYEVAGDKLMAIGAKRAKAADQKANRTKTAGGRPAGETGNKSYKDMPLSDFGKELEDAKLRR